MPLFFTIIKVARVMVDLHLNGGPHLYLKGSCDMVLAKILLELCTLYTSLYELELFLPWHVAPW